MGCYTFVRAILCRFTIFDEAMLERACEVAVFERTTSLRRELTAMNTSPSTKTLKERQSSDMTTEQQAPDETVKRIRKLRLIGLEDEAQALQEQLSRSCSWQPMLAEPSDTD